MFFLGYDLGSSSVKAALVDENNHVIGSTSFPDNELPIQSLNPDWAEQDPSMWWDCIVQVTHKILQQYNIKADAIAGIGISYQMHGLVVVDKNGEPLRPSIIWCDSRAVEVGNEITHAIGEEKCLQHLLNSPGNFTFSKLRWVQENEPEIFKKIHKVMLPGDFIAMKMSGQINTTISGLSEGTLWDFLTHAPAHILLDEYGISHDLIPDLVPTLGIQSSLNEQAAKELGLAVGTPIAYRAGDQPNNALSLGVLEPGEIAATGGTSGVVYGIQDEPVYDAQSRVNSFAHVNYTSEAARIGVLLCINGSGIEYRWIRQLLAKETTYDQMEAMLEGIPIGSDGVRVLPFGNGAERVFGNKKIGGQILDLDFNRHDAANIYRASLEGIAFSFQYGMEVLKGLGMQINKLRVGNDNLFQSKTFSQTISNLSGAPIEVVKTTGAIGAARAAAFGIGHFRSLKEAVSSDAVIKVYDPKQSQTDASLEAYNSWKSHLNKFL